MSEVAFSKPGSVDEAVALLTAAGDDARPLSGGATLVAMMNARLVEPSHVVSLTGIEELRNAEVKPDGTLRLGAMRRHRETAFETAMTDGQSVLAKAAARIANPPVRNMGTLGGSISFADPAADYPPALVAANASIEIAGPAGRRMVASEDFFLGWYETALEPGEIVSAVELPKAPLGSVGHYEKLARVAGDFALASVAVVLTLAPDNTVAGLRMAIGGCGGGPARVPEAEDALIGHRLEGARITEAAALVVAELDPVDDVRGSAEYRLKIVPGLIRRALETAAGTKEQADG